MGHQSTGCSSGAACPDFSEPKICSAGHDGEKLMTKTRQSQSEEVCKYNQNISKTSGIAWHNMARHLLLLGLSAGSILYDLSV
jgi:hypothetical protein